MSSERLEVAKVCMSGLLSALPESVITNRKTISNQAESYAECAFDLADALIEKAESDED